MPIKFFGANLTRPRKPAEPFKATPLQLPPEIVGQIVAYVLQSEDDWITLYRTAPRWRQPKFEAEIEGYILRQRRLESVRLASVSRTFLAEVLFNLKQSMRVQNIVIAGMRDMERQDHCVVQFLMVEREMLCDVSQRLTGVQDGEMLESRRQRTWRSKLSDAAKRMAGTAEHDASSMLRHRPWDRSDTNTCLCRVSLANNTETLAITEKE